MASGGGTPWKEGDTTWPTSTWQDHSWEDDRQTREWRPQQHTDDRLHAGLEHGETRCTVEDGMPQFADMIKQLHDVMAAQHIKMNTMEQNMQKLAADNQTLNERLKDAESCMQATTEALDRTTDELRKQLGAQQEHTAKVDAFVRELHDDITSLRRLEERVTVQRPEQTASTGSTSHGNVPWSSWNALSTLEVTPTHDEQERVTHWKTVLQEHLSHDHQNSTGVITWTPFANAPETLTRAAVYWYHVIHEEHHTDDAFYDKYFGSTKKNWALGWGNQGKVNIPFNRMRLYCKCCRVFSQYNHLDGKSHKTAIQKFSVTNMWDEDWSNVGTIDMW